MYEQNEEFEKIMCVCQTLSHVQLSATPWTVVHQAPPSMGLSMQEWVAIDKITETNFLKNQKSRVEDLDN